MRCLRCQNKIKETTKFCTHCGMENPWYYENPGNQYEKLQKAKKGISFGEVNRKYDDMPVELTIDGKVRNSNRNFAIERKQIRNDDIKKIWVPNILYTIILFVFVIVAFLLK